MRNATFDSDLKLVVTLERWRLRYIFSETPETGESISHHGLHAVGKGSEPGFERVLM